MAETTMIEYIRKENAWQERMAETTMVEHIGKENPQWELVEKSESSGLVKLEI
jgi:hypothetical protein